jgi:hypothetical protein
MTSLVLELQRDAMDPEVRVKDAAVPQAARNELENILDEGRDTGEEGGAAGLF